MRSRNVFFALVLLVAPTAFAQSGPVHFSFDSAVYSKYVWRGLVADDGPVWQSSVTASIMGLSLNYWGNFELDNSNNYGLPFGSGSGKFTEFDTTLTYEASVLGWDWSVGGIEYDYPNTGQGKTVELFGTLTHQSEWSPTIEIYTDIDAANGT
ncbi:MAG TPA: hypothetical protein VNI20_05785, partial [Fimbriimonadaceae bacterium]|nr:hypothetical protein [Fimbriimonadaceae bacterium]